MTYTLLMIWATRKPELILSNDREYLEKLIKDLASVGGSGDDRYYIFQNTLPVPRRIVDCIGNEIKYL